MNARVFKNHFQEISVLSREMFLRILKASNAAGWYLSIYGYLKCRQCLSSSSNKDIEITNYLRKITHAFAKLLHVF